LLPRTNPLGLFRDAAQCGRYEPRFRGGIRYREDELMPTHARLSRQGFLVCTAATTLIVIGFLAYEGVLNDIAHAISDLAYEIMRAINRE
jgi:hypothetical protein